MKQIKFSEITESLVQNAHFLVLEYEDIVTPNKKYVKVTLYDGETQTKINFFGKDILTVQMLEDSGIHRGCIIETDIRRNNQYLNVSNWKLSTDPTITKEDFAVCAPIDREKAFEYIINLVKGCDSSQSSSEAEKSIASLTLSILQQHKTDFMNSSAAISMHHNCLGGLLYHTYRMAQLADKICGVYDILDRELMICGTVLHDIGKLKCLSTDAIGTATMLPEGSLLEHAPLGLEMIYEASRNQSYNSEKLLQLKHMLLSHHGELEYGATVTPATPEAMTLHYIDMIDSRMYMFETAEPSIEPGCLSKSRIYGLEKSFIYRASYK